MSELEVQACPSCGAPLELDHTGRCAYCRARVEHVLPAFADLPPPARGILRVVDAVEGEPAVERLIADQDLAGPLAEVLDAVADAAHRVLDAGFVLDERRVDLRVYTPEEMWTFNLAADLAALLVAAPQLAREKRRAARDLFVPIDAALGAPRSRSAIGNAHDGPEALRELRAAVPHRTLVRR
ncbi:MAG: hypothetical protein U0Q07_04905 [Acidimicrobiales bacterium]